MALWTRFVREEEGLETVEYAVMAALLLVGVIATVKTLGSNINTKFNSLATAINS